MGRQPGEAAPGCIWVPLSLGGADVTLSAQDVAVVTKLQMVLVSLCHLGNMKHTDSRLKKAAIKKVNSGLAALRQEILLQWFHAQFAAEGPQGQIAYPSSLGDKLSKVPRWRCPSMALSLRLHSL